MENENGYPKKIIQEFRGEIGEVPIDDKYVFYATEFILDKIDEKFGVCYNQNFIKDLVSTIDSARYDYDEFSFDILENDFYSSIENAKTFKDINFSYCEIGMETLNKEISKGAYLKENINNKPVINKKIKEKNDIER